MLIFAGLGNPGAKYARNRHNIGFMAVEAIAREHGFPPFRARFQGRVSEGRIGSERVALLMPETFMNDSGQSVGQAMRFHKAEIGAVTVLHDELDLAPGKCRVKVGGGVAGHNGLRSISAHCGNDYRRVRLGIGHPGNKALVYNYVLNDFAKAEQPWVEALCEAVARNAGLLVSGEDAEFQNRVHRAMESLGVASS